MADPCFYFFKKPLNENRGRDSGVFIVEISLKGERFRQFKSDNLKKWILFKK